MPDTETNQPLAVPPTHPRGCQCETCKAVYAREEAEFQEAARILRGAGFIA